MLPYRSSLFLFLITERPLLSLLFFFNDPPPTEISTLSLHDALPISPFQPSNPTSATPPSSLTPSSLPPSQKLTQPEWVRISPPPGPPAPLSPQESRPTT